MWNDNTSADDQRHVDGFFLLGASGSEAVGLDYVVVDAVVTAQAGRGHQSHEFFGLRGQRAFHVGVVVEIVETLDEVIVGLVDVGVQAIAGFEKASSEFALFGDLFFRKEIVRFLAVCAHKGKD